MNHHVGASAAQNRASVSTVCLDDRKHEALNVLWLRPSKRDNWRLTRDGGAVGLGRVAL